MLYTVPDKVYTFDMDKIMIGGFSLYELSLVFFVYGFIGWCCEVIYAAVKRGKFINRGFLNGPICPIYGCGVALVLIILTPINVNFLVLFVASSILTTLLEFITGFALERIFHKKWWDYSAEHFNLLGYVCLRMSILWGLACVLIIDVVHPAIFGALLKMPHIAGYIILAVLTVVFITDLIFTIMQLLKLNKRFAFIEKLNRSLSAGSDLIGESLYKAASAVDQKLNEARSKLENSRLVKAFPKLGLKKEQKLSDAVNNTEMQTDDDSDK